MPAVVLGHIGSAVPGTTRSWSSNLRGFAMQRFPNFASAIGLAFALELLAAMPGATAAEDAGQFENAIGGDEYRISCSSCHGLAGKGDGPVAEFLKVKPADLTQISKKNGGVYPVVDIAKVIDGRTATRAHGNEMPVWGNRYSAESTNSYGPFFGEMVLRARILGLVFYLESVQEH